MNIDISQDICEGSGIIQLEELGQYMVTYVENMYTRGDIFSKQSTTTAMVLTVKHMLCTKT